MAKTPKLKKSTNPAPNSRLARKAAISATSLDHTPPPSSTAFLAPNPSGGITKKKPQQKPLKRKQRLRLETEKQKAENVRGKVELKVLGSLGKGERRNRRRRKWEEIDEGIAREGVVEKGMRKGKKKKGKQRNNQNGGIADEWAGDDEGDIKMDAVEMEENKGSAAIADGTLAGGGAESGLDEVDGEIS